MKYKIKILTYYDGEKRYDAFVKKFGLFWKDLHPTGRFMSREAAFQCIDKHLGNKVRSIEFEYITP